MIEILPNWHPLFVHFTVGLLATATVLFLLGSLFSTKNWSNIVLKAAYINLWLGAVITIGTVIAGLDAYNTVNHDTPSHLAMTDHRNWAFATATLFVVLAGWSAWRYRRITHTGVSFLMLLVIASLLLATTGFKGGELVYRHGLGVLSLPNTIADTVEKEENHHDHQGHQH